jgi:hypothetical protein
VEKRETLARVHVRLKSGSGVLQAGKRQALRYAKRVLVGMTTDTARSRPKACLLALFVASMSASCARAAPTNRKEERVANQSNHARESGSRGPSPSFTMIT